jgi:hypothetical protein
MRQVFISHASSDRSAVERTVLPLFRAHGIRYWYSSEDIPSASDWEKVIRQALTDCDWFLVALSANSVQSDWVQAEVHWALDNRKDHFVSLLLTDCTPSDLHLKLIRYQHVDFRQPSDEAGRRLVEAFGIRFQSVPSLRIHYRLGPPSEPVHSLVINETADIGRAHNSSILLLDSMVSRRHAMLKVRACEREAGLWLSDLGSSGGVTLNGIAVREPVQVRAGDCLIVGRSEIHILAINQP